MMSREARKALAFECGFGAPKCDPFCTMVRIWADGAASTSRTATTRAVADFALDYEHFRRKALGVDARRALTDLEESDSNEHVVF